MKEIILENLDRIEKEHRVKIILACESGSRAWGFPSRDSDYDVRFLYVNEKDWYLAVAEKRDVIELPIEDEIDLNGWDLRKALQLLRKSNSPLLEWLSSPIRYRCWGSAVDSIVGLSEKAFMPKSACHHYLSMARNSMSKFQKNGKINIKAYMYALRPILCCEWIVKNLSQPPMHISDLISDLLTNNELKKIITKLIGIKKAHSEDFRIQRSSEIEKYLIDQLAALSKKIPENSPKPKIEEFDEVFREILCKLTRINRKSA
jgi:predicted nucleotidyltransferase